MLTSSIAIIVAIHSSASVRVVLIILSLSPLWSSKQPRQAGISPDLLLCRCEAPVEAAARTKLSISIVIVVVTIIIIFIVITIVIMIVSMFRSTHSSSVMLITILLRIIMIMIRMMIVSIIMMIVNIIIIIISIIIIIIIMSIMFIMCVICRGGHAHEALPLLPGSRKTYCRYYD